MYTWGGFLLLSWYYYIKIFFFFTLIIFISWHDHSLLWPDSGIGVVLWCTTCSHGWSPTPTFLLVGDLSAWPFLDSLAKMAPPPSLAVGGLCQNRRFRHLRWRDGFTQLFLSSFDSFNQIFTLPPTNGSISAEWPRRLGFYLLKHKISTDCSLSEVNRRLIKRSFLGLMG